MSGKLNEPGESARLFTQWKEQTTAPDTGRAGLVKLRHDFPATLRWSIPPTWLYIAMEALYGVHSGLLNEFFTGAVPKTPTTLKYTRPASCSNSPEPPLVLVDPMRSSPPLWPMEPGFIVHRQTPELLQQEPEALHHSGRCSGMQSLWRTYVRPIGQYARSGTARSIPQGIPRRQVRFSWCSGRSPGFSATQCRVPQYAWPGIPASTTSCLRTGLTSPVWLSRSSAPYCSSRYCAT